MSDTFKIKCPNCQVTLNAPAAKIGQKANCPKCKKPFLISRPQKQAESEPKPNQERATLDPQPTHAEEISQDKRRFLAAVSMEQDKYVLVEPYLMNYEEPIAIAVQRQFPFSIFADIVLLTSHRLLIFNRFFTKIDMFDLDYIEFYDVTLKQGFFTSSLTILGNDGSRKTVGKLVTEQALKVYRLCQDIETKARIARRQYELEENRSKTTTMQVNNVVPLGNTLPPSGQTLLSHREIANIGDEEKNPWKSGQ